MPPRSIEDPVCRLRGTEAELTVVLPQLQGAIREHIPRLGLIAAEEIFSTFGTNRRAAWETGVEDRSHIVVA